MIGSGSRTADEPEDASSAGAGSSDRASARVKGAAHQARVLRDIIAHIPYVVFWKNIDSVYLGCNEALARIAGLDSPEDIVGRDDFMMPWSREQAEFFRLMDRRVMDSGKAEINIEESQRQADGRERVILTSKVPLRDEFNEVVGILGIFTDITERKELEEQLRRAKEAAEASTRAKSDFLAVMSHELRTPLTLILSPLESLLRETPNELSPRVRGVLESIHRNASRLKLLTDDVLDYSKHEAGHAELSLEPIDVPAYLAQLVQDLAPAAVTRGLTLELTRLGDGLGRALVDLASFDKIFLNLLGNALKFTPPGGHVGVSAELDANHGDVMVFTVLDTGIGIDPAQHERLFRRFEQGDGGPARRHGGTGLGLSLVKAFAERMGGSVSVVSELGCGAAFTVRLPRNAADAGQALVGEVRGLEHSAFDLAWAVGPGEVESGRARAAPDGAPRVVVAEDSPELRRYLNELLRDEFQVTAVGDGQQAYDAVRAQLPDAVVSDVMMPVLDGFELVRALKADPELAHIPVLLLTARAGVDAAAESLDHGADDYLSKPFSPVDLRARVRAACRTKVLHDKLLEAQRSAAALERQETLRETRAALADLTQVASLAEMAAALAHEVSQPLAGVGGNADACLLWLDHDPSNVEEAKSAALRIARDAKRAADVLHRIRKLFAKSAEEHAPVNMNDAVEEVVALTLGRVQRAGSTLRSELASDLPPALGDRIQLQQVVMNLVVNAAEAMLEVNDRRREVVLRTRFDAGYIRVEVSDAGIGVPPAERGLIFKAFHSTKRAGMGMGLSICKTIVESHDGRLDVMSHDGPGSTFWFRVPIAAAR